MERMTAFLIERHVGRFPVWLAPVQLVVLPVGDAHPDTADELVALASSRDVRATVVNARHSLGARVRQAHERGIPFVGVIGGRELTDRSVSLRRRDGLRSPMMGQAEAVAVIASLAAQRSRTSVRHDVGATAPAV